MTLPVSSSSSIHLDLSTINSVCDVVVRELRNQVCTWEQQSLDAACQGDYRGAQQLKDWAFACDLAVSKVFTATGALFQDALTALPIVSDTRTVELPNLNRSDTDRHLDDLAIEVASAQPCPEG